MTNLEELFVAKCAVTDAGLASVKNLSQLQVLNVFGTQMTSAGWEHMSGLENLRMLYITDVKLKADVVNALKKKLPRLVVTDFTAE